MMLANACLDCGGPVSTALWLCDACIVERQERDGDRWLAVLTRDACVHRDAESDATGGLW